jgi:hypothetical protein
MLTIFGSTETLPSQAGEELREKNQISHLCVYAGPNLTTVLFETILNL